MFVGVGVMKEREDKMEEEGNAKDKARRILKS